MGTNATTVFFRGLATGLLLQLAIGPVFLFILGISLEKGIPEALFSVLAVTAVDFFYIMLAALGVGRILANGSFKKALGISSSITLVAFGIGMSMHTEFGRMFMPPEIIASSYLSSFLLAFLLTASSPLTIVFWTGLFAAKAIEYELSKRQLLGFGLSAGLATILFLGSTSVVFGIMKRSLPSHWIGMSNIIVGSLLMAYGMFRLLNVLKNGA